MTSTLPCLVWVFEIGFLCVVLTVLELNSFDQAGLGLKMCPTTTWLTLPSYRAISRTILSPSAWQNLPSSSYPPKANYTPATPTIICLILPSFCTSITFAWYTPDYQVFQISAFHGLREVSTFRLPPTNLSFSCASGFLP